MDISIRKHKFSSGKIMMAVKVFILGHELSELYIDIDRMKEDEIPGAVIVEVSTYIKPWFDYYVSNDAWK